MKTYYTPLLAIVLLILLATPAFSLQYVDRKPTDKYEEGFSFVYDTKAIIVPVYEVEKVYHSGECSWNASLESVWCEKPYYTDEVKSTTYETHYQRLGVIGVQVGGKTYFGKYQFYDFKRGVLVRWIVPIGDRNFREFGYCLPQEKNKGICTETII